MIQNVGDSWAASGGGFLAGGKLELAEPVSKGVCVLQSCLVTQWSAGSGQRTRCKLGCNLATQYGKDREG